MGFLKKLFGKKHESSDSLLVEDRTQVQVKNKEFTYKDFTEAELKVMQDNVSFFGDAFPTLLKFEHEPANHPENLDEYLELWSHSNYDSFLGIEQQQSLGILSYNFGQYMVDKYGFKWQVKSDGHGEQTVIRILSPVEIELYPVDSTINAINKKKNRIYTEIERKYVKATEMFEK